jgi:NADH-quinone oxidoreductase subunit B
VAVNDLPGAAARGERQPVHLGLPSLGPERAFGGGFDLAPRPMKVVLNWGRKYSLWVFNFGLACCAIEFISASMARHDFIRLGVIPFAPGPRQADLMIVSGTVSDKMAPAVKRLYEQMPEPKYVISFGACSNCGGPYWDSYSVTKGVDQIIPVDVYVPGCPPRPEALLQGIIKLQEKIAAEGVAAHPSRPGRPPRPVRPARIGRRPASDEQQPAPIEPAATRTAAPAPPDTSEAGNTATVPPHADLPAGFPQPPAEAGPAALVETAPPAPAEVLPAGLAVPKPPRRRYFRELRRARDQGLSLIDQAASDQEWEHEDER